MSNLLLCFGSSDVIYGAFSPAVVGCIDTFCKCVVQVYAWLGVEPPRGVLLHGPPGCGKTALANAIANQCGVPFLRVSAPEIVSGMSGTLFG